VTPARLSFSENRWVGPSTNLSRGFDRFDQLDILHRGRQVAEATGEWLRGRRPNSPFLISAPSSPRVRT
jgi:hypothetical protein